jgi:hypothetical protein
LNEKLHDGLPVAGYLPQTSGAVGLVNANKELEKRVLRRLDELKALGPMIDGRWLAIGRTHIEEAFMAIDRAVFQPSRAHLPNDPA